MAGDSFVLVGVCVCVCEGQVRIANLNAFPNLSYPKVDLVMPSAYFEVRVDRIIAWQLNPVLKMASFS